LESELTERSKESVEKGARIVVNREVTQKGEEKSNSQGITFWKIEEEKK